MHGRLLLVFVKSPVPGAVKTRLAATLGDAAAAAVARALAERVLEQTRPAPADYDRVVVFAPAAAAEEVARWLPGHERWPQEGRDLGARMAAAFERGLQRAARVVLVGSDVPALDRDRVREAFAALERHAIVLGPARDGGYYLIGLTARQPALFEGVSWGTPSVLQETLARAAALGEIPVLLEPLADVDTLEDLRAEWPQLLSPGVLDPGGAPS